MSGCSHPTNNTNMNASVFDEEQHHLHEVYNTLEEIAYSLAVKIEAAKTAAAQEKEDMSGEIAPNFASDTDTLETYAEYATANNLIGAYNIAQESYISGLKRTTALLNQPYFAKISLQYKPNEAPKDIYLGIAGATDRNYKRLVVDWRSPVAEVYYGQESGKTSYVANGKTISVDLKLRRQFDITKDTLNAYFDTTVAIQDALLLKSLSQERSTQMQAITATIQKEQNKVIRHNEVPALLVSGIAGSGKTSVLLQRIAYLFYQNRTKLKPQEVYLISPNRVFSKYIEQVLPSLGEDNPETVTWEEFAKELLPFGRSLKTATNSLDEILAIDKALEHFHFEEEDIKDITIDGTRLISAAQIVALMRKFPNAKPGPHLVTLVREALFEKLNSRLAQLAGTEKIQNEVLLLPLDKQVDLFNGPYDPLNEEDAAKMARIYLNDRFSSAIDAVEHDEWLRIDRVGQRILSCENMTSATWLYLKCALTGMSNFEAKYVIIDEVQDYASDQLAVLARYFKNAKFMMLGDEYQAIKEQSAGFEQVRETFTYLRGSVDTCELMTSYRSTPRVTQLFISLLPENVRGKVQTVQRVNTPPYIKSFATDNERLNALKKLTAELETQQGLSAIIVPWKSELKLLSQQLGADAPITLDGSRHMPTNGVVALTLEQAKGLEFDTVVIPNACECVFPGDSKLARNRLYTTISRSNKNLYMLSTGSITSLLSANPLVQN